MYGDTVGALGRLRGLGCMPLKRAECIQNQVVRRLADVLERRADYENADFDCTAYGAWQCDNKINRKVMYQIAQTLHASACRLCGIQLELK